MSEKSPLMNRRLFVGGGIVLAVATLYMGAVGRGALKACGEVRGNAELPPDVQPLIQIGKAHLKDLARKGEPAMLNDVFLDARVLNSDDIVGAVQRRLLALDRESQDEFERGETVIVDGWVLAKSEARFCAALALRAERYNPLIA